MTTHQPSTHLRSAAVKYASLGYAIIPLHWIRSDESCSCSKPDCNAPGKHPIGIHGASDPITDAEQAAIQWEEIPDANIGIVAGPSRLLIIDIDSEAARQRFKSIADDETTRAISTTLISKTGKGWHIIFADPEEKYAPSVGRDDDKGIDIRAGVSYIVAPPSKHANGHEYAWVQGEAKDTPPSVPAWLDEYVTTRSNKSQPTIISEGATISEGSRNATMTKLLGSMRSRGFSEDEMRAAGILANQRINKPPMSEHEVSTIARSMATYEPSAVPHSLEIATTTTDQLRDRLHGLDTHHLVTNPAPIINWVWDDYMAPSTLNMLHGDGGLGKSYLSLKLAEQMLKPDGGELFGKTIHHGGVVILDGENAEVQIHHRIHNTMISPEAPLKIFSVDQPILGYEEKTLELFDWIAAEYDPRLVIIDSQRALWSGDEREQMEVGRMLRAFAKGLEKYQYATLLLHHDNRGKDYAGSSDMNAAISGARLHLEKHGNKDDTQARRLSMPKNRIGPEMSPREFFLTIETQPRSHREQISGIGIRDYESGAQTQSRELLEQAKMKILNGACTNEELWAAFGWEIVNYRPRRNEHRELWELIAIDLEHAGFSRERETGGGNRRLWRHTQNNTYTN